jgi:hypothetical protein
MDTAAGTGVHMTVALPSPRPWASWGSEQTSCVRLSTLRGQVLPCAHVRLCSRLHAPLQLMNLLCGRIS